MVVHIGVDRQNKSVTNFQTKSKKNIHSKYVINGLVP